jgi:hypothetical protein
LTAVRACWPGAAIAARLAGEHVILLAAAF